MSEFLDLFDIFKIKDLEDYKPLKDQVATTAVTQGSIQIYGDRLCYHMVGKTAAQIADGDNLLTPVFESRQTVAKKRTGTGEAFQAGDKVYLYPNEKRVSPNPVGTAGTDYYYCGTALENAAATATTVLIEFDGKRYTEDV